MYRSIVFIETLTNGFAVELLYVISLASIIFGLFVVICKNPVVSVCAPFWIFSAHKVRESTIESRKSSHKGTIGSLSKLSNHSTYVM